MLKSRLIFTLLYADGYFHLSRNFNLQKVGDLSWIKENFDFESIAKSIDELIILNVGRENKSISGFTNCIKSLTDAFFMPIASGGGITNIDDVYKIFDAGSDKIVLNTVLFENPALVSEIAKIFGEQSIIASLDYTRAKRDVFYSDSISSNNKEQIKLSDIDIMINNGSRKIELFTEEALVYINNLGVGEIYITSIDCSGVARGYDLDVIKVLSKKCKLPLIISGGGGNFYHLFSVLEQENISAVSTSNLFNFMADGLCDARNKLISKEIKLSKWLDFDNNN
jgi:imidazole glycerol-phosphate synthase subunit HisF